jgi:hypothetical protein
MTNIIKRLLIHAGAFSLGLVMRKISGHGTPRGLQGYLNGFLFYIRLRWKASVNAIPRQGPLSEPHAVTLSKNATPLPVLLLCLHSGTPMIPARQEEFARLMIASGRFISPYVRALIGASGNAPLANPKGRPRRLVMNSPQRDAANKEISELSAHLKELSALSGTDPIVLFVSSTVCAASFEQ